MAGIINGLVTVFAGYCTLDRFVIRVAPGLAQLPATKILHLDKFLAPGQLIPQYGASAFSNFLYLDCFPVVYQTRTAIAQVINRICTRSDCYRQAKTCASAFVSTLRGKHNLPVRMEFIRADLLHVY